MFQPRRVFTCSRAGCRTRTSMCARRTLRRAPLAVTSNYTPSSSTSMTMTPTVPFLDGMPTSRVRRRSFATWPTAAGDASTGSERQVGSHVCFINETTGYNQSVTGRGSQRIQCSCYSTKTHVNSMILILKLNLISLRNKCFSTKSNSI